MKVVDSEHLSQTELLPTQGPNIDMPSMLGIGLFSMFDRQVRSAGCL